MVVGRKSVMLGAMKELILELIPIALLGVALLYLKFKKPVKIRADGKPSWLARVSWENWILTLIAVMALAYAISRAAL